MGTTRCVACQAMLKSQLCCQKRACAAKKASDRCVSGGFLLVKQKDNALSFQPELPGDSKLHMYVAGST